MRILSLTSALSITLLGLFLLSLLLIIEKPKEVEKNGTLTMLQNEKITVAGKVVEEKIFPKKVMLILDNNTTLICDCRLPPLQGKNIKAVARINHYQHLTELKILTLTYYDR